MLSWCLRSISYFDQCWKQLHCFCGNWDTFFQDFLLNRKFKRAAFIEIYIFCSSIHITVKFDLVNLSLLNKNNEKFQAPKWSLKKIKFNWTNFVFIKIIITTKNEPHGHLDINILLFVWCVCERTSPFYCTPCKGQRESTNGHVKLNYDLVQETLT